MRKPFPVVAWTTLTCFLAMVYVSAGAAAAEKPAQAPSLREDLDRLFAEAGLPKTVVACRVLDVSDPEAAPRVLYSVRADEPLIPASTMKLLVTSAAWDRFGREWRIRTQIGHLPRPGGGPPDLVVLGGGDPNFSGRFYGGDPAGALRRWAKALRAAGLTDVGRILLDDGLFEPPGPHPNWPEDQLYAWYEAPVGALNLNDNCVDVRVGPGAAVGRPAHVTVSPATAYVHLENHLGTVAPKAPHAYSVRRMERPGGGLDLIVRGTYRAKAGPMVHHRTVLDPTAYFGAVLAETFRAEGVRVRGEAVRAPVVGSEGAPEAIVWDVIHASRLELCARVANTRSQGLYAECLLKLLGAYARNPDARYGAPEAADRPALGSWASGRAALAGWLAERGLPTEGCVFDDGSGLSKANRLTPRLVTETLALMVRRHGSALAETLARPGRPGSLRKRMRHTDAEDRVWAKTGYVRGVSALSGYVRTRGERTLAFAILMNEVPWGELWRARLVQDNVCLRLVEVGRE